MRNSIGCRQVFKTEARFAFFVQWPLYAFRAHGIAGHIHDVPAAALVLPFARISAIDEVAPKQKACDFIVETYGVVADANGLIAARAASICAANWMFWQALLKAPLRRDMRDQTRLWIWQVIVGGRQKNIDGLPISLRSASVRMAANCAGRSRRATAPKFVVMPKKTMCLHRLIDFEILCLRNRGAASERSLISRFNLFGAVRVHQNIEA